MTSFKIWTPDWKDPNQYPDHTKTRDVKWAWEFLRRNPQYQREWSKQLKLLHTKKISLKDSLEIFRIRFGLLGDFPPDPKFSATSFWTIRFAEQPGEFFTFESQRYYKGLNKNQIAWIFDFERNLAPQIKYAKFIMAKLSKNLEVQSQLKVKRPRNHKILYSDYLRALDAREEGASYLEIAKVLYPKLTKSGSEQLKQKAKDMVHAALKLRDGGYQSIALPRVK